jgi:tetratricopeptide (TPR) repeat protein
MGQKSRARAWYVHKKAFQRLVVNFYWATGSSEASCVEEILHQTEQLEKDYDWLGATELYQKALKLLSANDFSRMGQICERLGTAFYRAAMQAERQEKFRQGMQLCTMSYDKAATCHEKSEDLNETASMFRCKAMVKLANYWSESEAGKKKHFLEEFLSLVKNASALFEKAGNTLEYGRTFNLAFPAVDNLFNLEWDVTAGKKLLDETIRFGEHAVTLLSHTEHQEELAKTCVKLSYLTTRTRLAFHKVAATSLCSWCSSV